MEIYLILNGYEMIFIYMKMFVELFKWINMF